MARKKEHFQDIAVQGLYATGSFGTAGQVLKSDGDNVYWDTAVGDATTLDGYDSTAFARLAASNIFTQPQIVSLNPASGPTIPSGTLVHIIGNNASQSRLFFDVFGSNAAFLGRRANGTNAVPTQLIANDIIFTLGGFGYFSGGSSGYAPGASALALVTATENFTDVGRGAKWSWRTTTNGTITPVERWHLDHDGSFRAEGLTATGVGTVNAIDFFDSGTNINAIYASLAGATFSGNITISNAAPYIDIIDNNAAADVGKWRIDGSLSALGFYAFNDAASTFNPFLTVGRSGATIGAINLSGTSLTFNSVEIPTISSTSTLTNKTLTSPTINGGTISGTFSGTPTFSIVYATNKFQANGTYPAIEWYQTDGAVDEKYWRFIADGIAFDLQMVNDAYSTAASALKVTRSGLVATSLELYGVAVPTISSTHTFTNKTLTNPTINAAALSGTFSGTPTFSGTVAFTGQVTMTRGAVPLQITTTVDNGNVEGFIIEGDRATPTANDIVYTSWRLSNSAGTQTEFGRQDIVASTVTAASEASYWRWSVRVAGTLTTVARLSGTAFTPHTNDALALGNSSLMWSDLFLASGGVINFNNGDVLVTHSANLLAFTGASSGYTFDASVTSTGLVYATNGFSATSGNSFEPQLQLTNTNNDNTAGYLILNKNPADTTLATNDYLGTILFQGRGSSSIGQGSQITSTYRGTRGTNWVDANLQFGVTNSAGTMLWTYINSNGGITSDALGTVWGSLNDGSGTGLDADLLDGYDSLVLAYGGRAQRLLTGGGTITVDASGYVLWATRFIVISGGRGASTATSGYYDINCPTSGTITGVGGAADVTATAAGIPIAPWQALYYILPLGSTNTSLAANFRVASYTSSVDIPEHWLLICTRNGDGTSIFYFNNGIQLGLNDTYTVGTVWNSANDGAGSGSDADLWDGNQFATYLNQTLLTSSNPTFVGLNITTATATAATNSYLNNGVNAWAIGRAATSHNFAWYKYNTSSGAYIGNPMTLRHADDVLEFAVAPYVLTNVVWHAGNDGAGSGLNADLLDGYDIGLSGGTIGLLNGNNTYSGISTHTAEIRWTSSPINSRMLGMPWAEMSSDAGGNGVFGNNLYANWDGASVTYRTVNTHGSVGYGAIRFGYGATGIAAFGGATTAGATVTPTWHTLWHSGNDGSGSGLDADTLDGYSYASFVLQNNVFNTTYIGFTHVGGNSSMAAADYALYQEAGAWTHPYPDLIFSYHTGIKIMSTTSYGGTKFYGLTPSYVGAADPLFIVGNLDNATSHISHPITSTTTDGFGLEFLINGVYVDGRYAHRLAKYDATGGVPLYMQKTSGTAGAWTTIARFGVFTGNEKEFEVFGPMGVTNGDNSYTTYGPNTTYSAYLHVGSGNPPSRASLNASIVASDGNLHLDSGASQQIYLNYYTSQSIYPWREMYYQASGSGKYWHGLNDGAGSGLDADLLDGINSTSFLRSDLNQQGGFGYVVHDYNTYPSVYSVTFVNPTGSTNLPTGMGAVTSYRFIMAGGDTTSRGVDIVATQENPYTNIFVRERTYGGWSKLWHNNNDGSGSGLDADLFDGLNSTVFLYGINGSGTSAANPTQTLTELAQYKSGFWEVNAAGWTPDTGYWWGLTMAHTSNGPSYNYGGQIVIQNSGGTPTAYLRSISGGGTPSATAWQKIWTAAVDGAGTGLDADLLDGFNSNQGNEVANSIPVRDSSGYLNQRVMRNLSGAGSLDGMYIGYGNASSGITRIYGGGSTGVHFYMSGAQFLQNGGSTEDHNIRIGGGRSGSGYAYLDIVGDTTYSGYGLRLIRLNSGANAASNIEHRGTGSLQLIVVEGGYLTFHTSSVQRAYFHPTQNYLIDSASAQAYWTGANDGSGSGLDADLFDGRNSTEHVFGDAGYGTSSLANMNTGAKSGFYTYDNPTNGPAGTWTQWINVRGHSWGDASQYVQQIAWNMFNNSMYTRCASNNIWSAWFTMWHSGNDGAGTGLDADLLDGQQGSYYAAASAYVAKAGDTMSGLLVGAASASTDVNTANDGGSFSCRGDGTTGKVASMSFHRTGNYAINMGLGADNVFRIGGWSAANNCVTLDGSGNLTALANISAYSDIKLKEDMLVIDCALDKVQALTGYTYTRKDTKQRQTGLIAQDVEKVLPEAVSEMEGIKTLAYGNMMGLMVEAIKELKGQVDSLKAEILEIKNGNAV